MPTIHANDQLEHSLLAAWSQASDVGLCVVDDSFRLVMLNPAACRLLGVDGLRSLDQPLQEVFASIEGNVSLVQWLSTPGVDGERHVSRITDSGSVELLLRSTTLRALPGLDMDESTSASGSDGASGLFKVMAITDVTAVLVAQRRIDSEAFRRQWQALNAGVVISDARSPDLPIIYVNAKFEKISGYSAAEILGRNCRWLQGNDTDQPGLADIRNAIKNKTNGYAKLRNYRKDGSMFINELFISPVLDDSGTVTHFVGIQNPQNDTELDGIKA